MKQTKSFKLKILHSVIIVLAILTSSLLPSYAAVAQSANCKTSDGKDGVRVSIGVDTNNNGKTENCIAIGKGVEGNVIFKYLIVIIQFMAAGVGLAVVGGIIYGGFLYITARANAAQVEKGRTVIINSVVGLLMFIFMYAILEFLIPGNIFG